MEGQQKTLNLCAFYLWNYALSSKDESMKLALLHILVYCLRKTSSWNLRCWYVPYAVPCRTERGGSLDILNQKYDIKP